MKHAQDAQARKRAVNLSLNESVVSSARALTDNLSELVEDLLAEHVASEQARIAELERVGRATSGVWNEFADRHGSFADEHSTL
jgi:antitoxin CcdA